MPPVVSVATVVLQAASVAASAASIILCTNGRAWRTTVANWGCMIGPRRPSIQEEADAAAIAIVLARIVGAGHAIEPIEPAEQCGRCIRGVRETVVRSREVLLC